MFAELDKINKERQRGESPQLQHPLKTEAKHDLPQSNASPQTPPSPPLPERSQHSSPRAARTTTRTTGRSADPALATIPSPQTRGHPSTNQSIAQSIDRTPV